MIFNISFVAHVIGFENEGDDLKVINSVTEYYKLACQMLGLPQSLLLTQCLCIEITCLCILCKSGMLCLAWSY